MGLAITQTEPTAEAVKKLAMLPPGKQDVDGEDLVMLPGNWLKVKLDALAAANDIVAAQNPFGVDVLITRAILRVKTAGGTATAVIDVDVVDAETDTGDTIIDGADANATGITDSQDVAGSGTNATEKAHLWEKAGGTNDHLSAKLLVEAAASLEADLYVQVIPIE